MATDNPKTDSTKLITSTESSNCNAGDILNTMYLYLEQCGLKTKEASFNSHRISYFRGLLYF